MLRIVFLLLLLANAGYYLWSHGHLAGLGLAPVLQSEPQRLEEQIKPEALSFDKPGAAVNEKPQPSPAPLAPVQA